MLGADGFGRSDTRENLRRFFEVDKEHVTRLSPYQVLLAVVQQRRVRNRHPTLVGIHHSVEGLGLAGL